MQESTSISETEFVVVDTETTGTSAERDRVIELAAVKVVGGKIIDRMSQLINPRRTVPRRITRITGITTAMVYEQPTIAEVVPSFLEFLGEGVFVAQNCLFDLRFLNAELRRLGREELPNKKLCTLRLARRLLPGLQSKGLSSLVNFYGINTRRRHRALGDAEATAIILTRFLQRLEFEYEIESVQDVLAFQYKKYTGGRTESAHLQRIRQSILPQVPAVPGVYFMTDERGHPLYVGKAKSLQDRVRSYFSGIEGHSEHIRKLVRVVRDVRWTESGSELEALLLESKLIKKYQPSYNRAQRRYRRRPFLRLDVTHEAPAVALTTTIRDDGAEYYGPLGGRRQGELVLRAIGRLFHLRECTDDVYERGQRCLYADIERCDVPCEAVNGYESEVERVRAFLTGVDYSAMHLLEERMQRAAEALKFEEAAAYRDMIRSLKRILKRQGMVAAPVLRHHAVLVQPGFEPGTDHYFIVRSGRLAERVTLPARPSKEERSRLRKAITSHLHPECNRPEVYFKPEIEEVRLLAYWMAQHEDEIATIPVSLEMDADAIMDRVLAIE